MPPVTADPAAAGEGVYESFAELICADSQLLEREFLALVRALRPPAAIPAAVGSPRARGSGADAFPPEPAALVRLPSCRRRPAPARERSPPRPADLRTCFGVHLLPAHHGTVVTARVPVRRRQCAAGCALEAGRRGFPRRTR